MNAKHSFGAYVSTTTCTFHRQTNVLHLFGKKKKVKRYSMCMVDALGLDADEGRVRLR